MRKKGLNFFFSNPFLLTIGRGFFCSFATITYPFVGKHYSNLVRFYF